MATLGLSAKLLKEKDTVVDTTEALKDKEVIGLYFSAHWCPPCRGFTPHLASKYKEILSDGKSFEIVFISSDRDEEAFNEYFSEMPWLALPYGERALKEKLSRKFQVSGIPTLVLLDGNGELITTKGRSKVDDVQGFPWPKKSLKEILGNELVGSGGDKIPIDTAINGKVLGLYFSAHWCGPCRNFTPLLAKKYHALKDAGKNIEIVFVSSDRDEDAFNEYFSEMPWLALPYDKRKEKSELSDMFDVNGIPTFVIIGENGQTITTGGRGKISADSFIEDFPYYPKPVNDISEDLEGINDHAALLVFMEALDDDAQNAACSELTALAKVEMERADEDRIFVFTAKGGGPVDKIRTLVGKTGPPATEIEMVILDVPSGCYHEPEKSDTAFSAASVKSFLESFRSGSLTKNDFKR